MSKGYFAPSVRKAFEILKLIGSSRGGVGVSEIARDLKMAKSTVHGMTSALKDLGVIKRDPNTKKYTLGVTLFELGRRAYSQADFKNVARPVMEWLMEKTQASVFLGVLNWDHVTVVDIVESKNDLKITSPIGTTIPVLAGAVGKVFLAEMEEEQAIRLIKSRGLVSYTKNSVTDPAKYLEEIRAARARGYATDDEEYILGVWAVAAPIRGWSHLRSAIWAVGFKASLDEKKMEAFAKYTKEAAEAINRKIQE